VNAVFIGRCNRRCNGWYAEDRKHRHDTTEVGNALVGTENTRGLYMNTATVALTSNSLA
jgi:hypothetical protein